MVSALLGVRNIRMIWVGWAKLGFDDPTQSELAAIRRAMWARGCVPVFLNKSEAELYYNGCAPNPPSPPHSTPHHFTQA